MYSSVFYTTNFYLELNIKIFRKKKITKIDSQGFEILAKLIKIYYLRSTRLNDSNKFNCEFHAERFN